jgi:hypothetical protein
LPTEAELDAERLSWSQNGSFGALASPLKWPVAGGRDNSSGTLYDVGTAGRYWGSTIIGTFSRFLFFFGNNAYVDYNQRANGYSIRCIKN